MSMKEIVAYQWACDTCERTYEEGDFGVFVDDQCDFEAYDWRYTEDGVLTCPYCVALEPVTPEDDLRVLGGTK